MPHQRRKSGHTSANTSYTDVRKSVTVSDMSKPKRPGLSRKHTPVSAQKLGKSHRERERQWEMETSFDDERESFPQFCMTCEKQFIPSHDRSLYCSESCRRTDLQSSPTYSMPRTYESFNYNPYSGSSLEPRDIVPQASPSRPSFSTHGSSSPPQTPGTKPYHSSAVSALRSLNLDARPPSPPSPSGSAGFWNFGRSAATSPSTSYQRPSAPYLSSTYDVGYYDLNAGGMDRPLPLRNPSSYNRPQSIDLVTPVLGAGR